MQGAELGSNGSDALLRWTWTGRRQRGSLVQKVRATGFAPSWKQVIGERRVRSGSEVLTSATGKMELLFAERKKRRGGILREKQVWAREKGVIRFTLQESFTLRC